MLALGTLREAHQAKHLVGKTPLVAASLAILLPVASVDQRPTWPSLERQIVADRVPPGSPLAALIAENQQLDLLRPAEAEDDLALPPWLRVLWRKSHPEARYSGDDPAGGYPLALKELHEWLASHPELALADGDPAAGSFASEAAGLAAAIAVGSNRRVSGAAPNPRSESDIRVDYWHPRRIVGAANNLQSQTSGALAVFSSDDGGSSWRQTLLPRPGRSRFHSDPTVDWTSDGTAWAATIVVDALELTLQLAAFRSADGGLTWARDATISGDQRGADKQQIWTDHGDRSPHRDNLYAIWHDGPAVYVNRRVASTGRWQQPLRVSGAETKGTPIGADVKTNGRGHVFGFWPDTTSRNLFVIRSVDGGASWSPPVALGKTAATYNIQIPAQGRRQALIYLTTGAFFRGPRRNMVYAAWTDLSGIPGCRSPLDEPRLDVNHPCLTRIRFARSADGGRTWSAPRALNDFGTGNDQFNPWLVVDETSGALTVIYYDTLGEGRVRAHVWAQASVDDGVTWSAPFRVTTAASEAPSDDSQLGDYNGLSGIAGRFFPAWTDRRGGGPTEIWTAPLFLQAGKRGPLRPDPSAALVCPFRFLAPEQGGTAEELPQPICEE